MNSQVEGDWVAILQTVMGSVTFFPGYLPHFHFQTKLSSRTQTYSEGGWGSRPAHVTAPCPTHTPLCASSLVSGLDQAAMGGAHHQHLGSALTTGSEVAGHTLGPRDQGSLEEWLLRPSGPTQP